MLSYIFSGLGEYVAPRTVSNKEIMHFLENSMFDKVLDVIKQHPHALNVNEHYESGLTPLHIACAGGALELTVELLSLGADVMVPSSVSLNTPLHFASMNNHKAVLEVLLRSGADPSTPNAEGLIAAELSTDVSVQRSLMNTNWLSRSNVPSSAEQHHGRSQSPQQEPCSDARGSSLPSDTELEVYSVTELPLELSPSQSSPISSPPASPAPCSSVPHLGASFAQLFTPSKKNISDQITHSLLDNKELTAKILRAVASTAESAATMHLEFTTRSELFKLCSRSDMQPEMAEKLSSLLACKPELALCRAVDMGNKASDGWTPLHCAAKFGNKRAIELLLQCEEVTAWECDLLGRLPLHVAAGRSNAEVCAVLMQAMQGGPPATPNTGTTKEKQLSTPPSAPTSLLGPHAPVDAAGTTPLGVATRESKGRPSTAMRELLYQPRDSSIFASSPFVGRSGRTPLKRASTSLRLRSSVQPTALTSMQAAKEPYEVDLSYAHSEAQGWRGEMEDQTILQCPLSGEVGSSEQHDLQWCFFGVLDGHGGSFTSKFVKKALSGLVAETMSQLTSENSPVDIQTVCRAVERCFTRTDDLLAAEPRMAVKSKVKATRRGSAEEELVVRDLVTTDNSGSTACTCLVGPFDFITANVGDSRAVLGQLEGSGAGVSAVNLSNDHKPEMEQESVRIRNAGCSVALTKNTEDTYEIATPLHSQILRVARSFGDFRFKWTADASVDGSDGVEGFRSLPPSEQAVTCMPEVINRRRSKRDVFLILACDGVWDVFTSQEAVDYVYMAFRQETACGNSLTEQTIARVSDSLVQACLDKGSTDNISVVLVTFAGLEQSCHPGAEMMVENNLEKEQDLELSPPSVNVNMVMADMNKNLPEASPMKGTKLF